MACIGKSTPWGSGATAVDIFMLLSGFLMAYHWHLRKERFFDFKHQTMDFYIRRFFRIAPLYYVLLTVAFLGQDYFFEMRDYLYTVVPPPWMTDAIEQTNIHHESVNISNIFAHYSFMFGFIPKYASSNMLPDWSIGLEMQFYLVFPFLMLAISRFGAFSVVITLIILSFITNKVLGLYLSQGILGNFPQPSLILFKISIFAAGISVALICLSKNTVSIASWAILAMLSLVNAASQVWAAALLIVFMIVLNQDNKELFGRLLSSRVAKFLGDTSYSVYLVHVMVYVPILYALFHAEWFLSLHMYLRLLVAFVLTAVPVYVISFILYKLIEIKGIQLGRHVLRKKS